MGKAELSEFDSLFHISPSPAYDSILIDYAISTGVDLNSVVPTPWTTRLFSETRTYTTSAGAKAPIVAKRKYKPVARKIRPVPTYQPDPRKHFFRDIPRAKPTILPVNPPDYTTLAFGQRVTRERLDSMLSNIQPGILLPSNNIIYSKGLMSLSIWLPTTTTAAHWHDDSEEEKHPCADAAPCTRARAPEAWPAHTQDPPSLTWTKPAPRARSRTPRRHECQGLGLEERACCRAEGTVTERGGQGSGWTRHGGGTRRCARGAARVRRGGAAHPRGRGAAGGTGALGGVEETGQGRMVDGTSAIDRRFSFFLSPHLPPPHKPINGPLVVHSPPQSSQNPSSSTLKTSWTQNPTFSSTQVVEPQAQDFHQLSGLHVLGPDHYPPLARGPLLLRICSQPGIAQAVNRADYPIRWLTSPLKKWRQRGRPLGLKHTALGMSGGTRSR
ncbi:RT-RNaseH domain-containing protein [Mycena indigotica]|uniref:RT-RNaseH domain-containing protein n=1 Tax=Mycena indigotica TaxID=2126181 RepID=A0A8H6VXE8_9AGAR|nr:RT-RNaseH domain-containing protein [Mycena indigotica]KAF7293703.1 RT-RNaseH domain-containing protein [Mycena indigotica]